jgi:FKBP-type peptidyl-prolyl cis-trans isomerase
MKRKVFTSHLLPLTLLFLLLVGCNGKGDKASAPELATQIDTLSWAYGQNFANVLSSDVFDTLDAELVLQAVRHTLNGKPQPISEQETRDALEFLTFLQSANAMRVASDKRTQVDRQQQEFFANLEASNPNAKRHPKGFYYEVVRPGKGPKAQYAERIRFDYRSYLMLSGEPYDQTYGKREPIVHVVGNPMFPGLIEAFQLMNAGSLYRFWFPYQLAFGEEGTRSIPGFTPFIYEVELHEIYPD